MGHKGITAMMLWSTSLFKCYAIVHVLLQLLREFKDGKDRCRLKGSTINVEKYNLKVSLSG